jgi:hypothetical protein
MMSLALGSTQPLIEMSEKIKFTLKQANKGLEAE